jgi:hypothetical protein
VETGWISISPMPNELMRWCRQALAARGRSNLQW